MPALADPSGRCLPYLSPCSPDPFDLTPPTRNFELPRVVSINASGHKFGLVYVGLGWAVWRDESYLPQDLIFTLDYLGGSEKSFTLNFSRPGAQVILQYYNLIHLGRSGYREIMENCLRNSRLLARSLEGTGWYTVISDSHRPVKHSKGKVDKKLAGAPGEGTDDDVTSKDFVACLPVVAFRLNDEFKKEFPHVMQESVSQLMRAREWIIPNYKLPRNEEKTEILRVVVRENMSIELVEKLVEDVCQVTKGLMESDKVDLGKLIGGRTHKGKREGKHADTHRGVC